MTIQPIENRRILIVDDNCSIHDDFRKILLAESNEQKLASQEALLFDEPMPAASMPL